MLRAALRLLAFVAVMVAYTAVAPALLHGYSGARRAQKRAALQYRGAQACLRALGVRLRVHHPVPQGPYLLAANHISLLDGFLLAALTPCSFTGRADVDTWPVLGWVTRTLGYLGVDRERRTATAALVRGIQDRLREGVPVVVFPEGTTSYGPDLLPLKTGAFEAVAQTEFPVLPVYLFPTEMKGKPLTAARYADYPWAGPNAPTIPRGFLNLIRHAPIKVDVWVGAEVPAHNADRKALRDAVQRAFAPLAEHGKTLAGGHA